MTKKQVASVDPSIFRAYDIRGIVGETLTEESVYMIGKALGSLMLENGFKQMVTGRDGRVSGPDLSRTLCNGILSTGCDVVDVGMVPTPLLYYAAQAYPERSGVMLTGSHNPSNYNGLKIVMNGMALNSDDITGIYERIVNQQFREGHGQYEELDIVKQYIDAVSNNVKLSRSLKVVIDAGNGVTGIIAPYLFRALGCDVHELHCEVDGAFPNHHPDPSQPENLKDLAEAVASTHADIGLAFDGDGDRLGVVTNHGEIIWPDRLLMLYAKYVLRDTPNAKVIFDVKCTNHLTPLVESLGGVPIMWKTGHSFIKAKIADTKAQLAGEMSGHFFFGDRWYGFDDALYAAARLLEILSEEQQDANSVFAAIPNSVNTPELKLPVAEEEKFALMQRLIDRANFNEQHNVTTIDGLRVNFADGWGLIRPSNTTPYLVMRFEAANEDFMNKMKHMFREWLLEVDEELVVPF